MKLSIITCTLNSEKYLEESIRSVRAQTYSDIEYVFVDGGSTDRTLEIIGMMAGEHRLLRDEGRGPAAAMNVGWRAARGDVVTFLPADDRYVDDRAVQAAMDGLCLSGRRWGYGRVREQIGDRLFDEDYTAPWYSRLALITANFVPFQSTFMARDLLVECGPFGEHWQYAAGYDMALRMGLRARPCEFRRPLTVFRRHAGSASTAKPFPAFREEYQVRCSHLRNPVLRWMHGAVFEWRTEQLFC